MGIKANGNPFLGSVWVIVKTLLTRWQLWGAQAENGNEPNLTKTSQIVVNL